MHSLRISLALLATALLLSPGLASTATGGPMDFETLRYKAKLLAAQPYEQRASRVPDWLMNPQFTYDDYRDIRFKDSEAWWLRDALPFRMQFFHPGFIYNKTVQISEIRGKKAEPIEFSSKVFDYGRTKLSGKIPADMGFSGFKILTTLNKPDHFDELAVFQGASYFRALCAKALYGLSARGLAIDTAEPTGEEFPTFEEFWVAKPSPDSREVTVFALLDSPSCAGAYRFVIKPGADTVVQVKCTLFMRKAVKALGVAPLTSMFWHGESSTDHYGDFRPEVHDSDGLMISHAGGEWLWRPLTNPAQVRSSAFADENPKGFGLVQRDRNFASYEDLEAKYHLRPSAYVETVGNWGKGFVRLVELPTPDETNDNIVAFWQPEVLAAAGEPMEFEYRLHWFLDQIKPPAGTTVGTRLGRSKTHEPDLQRFVVDFDSAYLHNKPEDPTVEAVVSVSGGAALVNQTIQKNTFNGSWRVAFAVRPDGSRKPVELRCFLRKEPHILTETWSYCWNP